MKMEDAAAIGDLFITVTGDIDVIRPEHVKKMKSGAVLANSGHFNVEIDLEGLKKISKKVRRVRPSLDEYTLADSKGKSAEKVVYVAGEGRLINLAAAEGHPSEVMSMSFCGQALAIEFLLKNKGKLKPQVYQLPENIDDEIAAMQLKTLGVKIDELTSKQKKYLSSWQEGT